MSDTTRNENVATDDPPVRDGAAETQAGTDERATDTAASTDTTGDTTIGADATTRADTTTGADTEADATTGETGIDDDATADDASTIHAGTSDADAGADTSDADADDAPDNPDDDDDDLTDQDDAEPTGRPMGLVIALGAVAAVAVVALAVTALLYPGFLLHPGSPDDRAAELTTALATKDGAALDAISCRTQDGQPLNPLTPDALTLIQSAAPAGPSQLVLDTQARAPIDLTLSAQGQTQTLAADIVLGVTDGNWCMSGLAQRQ